MFGLEKLFTKPSRQKRDRLAELIKVNPEALDAFNRAYALTNTPNDGNLTRLNADEALGQADKLLSLSQDAETIINRVVEELLAKSRLWSTEEGRYKAITHLTQEPFTLSEFKALPDHLRPQLTGDIAKYDIPDDGRVILEVYKAYQEVKNPQHKEELYNQFLHGLDILDINPIVYGLMNQEPNAMSNWLPQLYAVCAESALKFPKTTILKVPVSLLQTTRTYGFDQLSPMTLAIINRYATAVFGLEEDKTYFVKTGTFSSKYDFRNAKVIPSEVPELGSYLWFITSQTVQMCSPLTTRPTCGLATNNEWVVREYIADKEDNPTIYNGLPLHTEYRVFVDFDNKTLLGVSPYWRGDVMLEHFAKYDDPNNVHDYVVFKAHEETLKQRYDENVDFVVGEVMKLVDKQPLKGQWSIDIMQNGDDFYLIDAALAHQSALSDVVPKGLLKGGYHDWLTLLQESITKQLVD